MAGYFYAVVGLSQEEWTIRRAADPSSIPEHRGDGKKFLKLTGIDMVVDLHPTVAAATVGF